MPYSNPYIELCLEEPLSIFKDLSQKEKESIEQHHTLINIKKGDLIFTEGEKAKGLIFMAAGKAKVYKVGVGGREQILKMVKKGECIGYQALYDKNIWSFTAEAIEDSIICVLEKQTLIKILKKNIDLSFRFNIVLTKELCRSYERMVSLSQKHVRGRLIESLLMLANIYGYEKDGKTLNISISRKDIAHLSNMTTSNAIRTLSNLASEKKIGIKGKKIIIFDSNNLEHLNELG